MLVLTRKVEEGFGIGDYIFVKVLAIGQRRVKLGIEAPIESHIVRDQLSSGKGVKEGHLRSSGSRQRSPPRF